MSDGDIRNFTKGAYLVVEHKIPAIHDKPSKGVEHDNLSILKTMSLYVPIDRLDQFMELISCTTTSSNPADSSDLAVSGNPVRQYMPGSVAGNSLVRQELIENVGRRERSIGSSNAGI